MKKLERDIVFPSMGTFNASSKFWELDATSDGLFKVGQEGVKAVCATGDKKVEFIAYENKSMAFVKSELGYPAYYPVHDIAVKKPLKAVLMDLDGTTIKSESFWIWIIEKTTASLLGNPKFTLEESDIPFVSGHSVSEHLTHCLNKYCADKSLEEARKYYFEHTHYEMNEIMEGRGRPAAFTPTEGIKDFLMELKAKNIKIGLVTSGLYEKAWPEILNGFETLGMGDPKDFYDSIITAGFPLRKGFAGTLGELSPKPHPWLYAEVSKVGLGIDFADRNSVVGIEDSGAGVCSVRLAGFACLGLADGNIEDSGTKALCHEYFHTFSDIAKYIF